MKMTTVIVIYGAVALTLWGVAKYEQNKSCDALLLEQYNKRQKALSEMLSACEAQTGGSPHCINAVIAYSGALAAADSEELKKLGCLE